MKNKSKIEDNPWSEQLVGQALDEIFRVLQQIVSDRKRIPKMLEKIKEKEWFVSAKSKKTSSDSDSSDGPSRFDIGRDPFSDRFNNPRRGMKGKKKGKNKPRKQGIELQQSKLKAEQREILFNALSENVKDKCKSIKENSQMIEFEESKLLNEAYDLFDKYKEKTCLSYYFNMIHLLSNVAQVAPLPLKMLRRIATPYHLRLLFELLLVVKPTSKLRLIKIIKNLQKAQVPSTVFQSALKDPLLKDP